MAEPEKRDLGPYVDAAAAAIGLPIAARYRDAVIANLERTAQIAASALAEPLPDDVESAPVYRP